MEEEDGAVVDVDVVAVDDSTVLKGYVLGWVNQEKSVVSPSSQTLKNTSTDKPLDVGVTWGQANTS